MFREYDRFFALSFRVVEFLFVTLMWCAAFLLRFYVFGVGVDEALDVYAYVKAGFIVALLSSLFFSRAGLYRSQRFTTRIDEIRRLTNAHLLATLFFVVLLYFLGGERVSRLQIALYFIVGLGGLVSLRLGVRGFLRYSRRLGRNLRHVVVVGSGRALKSYIQSVNGCPELGIRIVCWQDSEGQNKALGLPELDGRLEEVIRKEGPDTVVLCYEGERAARLEKVLAAIHNDVAQIVVLPDLSYSYIGTHFDSIAGGPALLLNHPNYSPVSIVSKRILDAVAAGVGLFLLFPFMAAVAVGVKMSSPGPIFFWQERIGLDGRRFRMLKFRTMRIGSDVTQNGVPGWTTEGDPRKTKFGTFLRLTSVDELPQLWNVLIGEMSLVGPRPEQPYYVEKFREEIPAYMLRHRVKAGITGWAQINGWRGNTDLNKRIECDLYYIRNWSLWLDIKILFLTVFRGFVNPNAY